MWVRGLKLEDIKEISRLLCVAPHVGAWIETPIFLRDYKRLQGRTPCGCVD